MRRWAILALVAVLGVGLVAPAVFVVRDDPVERDGSAREGDRATSTTSPSTSLTQPAEAEPSARFVAAAGASPRVGSGQLFAYTVEVESSIDLDPADVAAQVDRILADPRGWTADGSVALQRVPTDQAPAFRVRLATPPTTDLLCAPLDTSGMQSCRQGEHVVVNILRWTDGSAASKLSLADYRSYVVSHEVGHALGHDHVDCPAPGALAPVMMQQTIGIGACAPNPWPFP